MSRLSPALPVLLLLAAGSVADPAKDPPKVAPKESSHEPVYEGKRLSEWVRQLGADDADARRKAEEAVWSLVGRSDDVVKSLAEVAADPKSGTSQTWALVQLGPKAVPTLTAGLWSPDERTRHLSLMVLPRIGADARPAVPSLVRLLTHPGADTRRAAAEALADVGGHAAVPALTKALEDRSADVRLAAAEALVRLGAEAKDVLPVLTAALKEGEAAGQQAALCLAVLGPEAAPAVPELAAQLAGPGREHAARLAVVLRWVGPPAKEAVPALKRILDGKPDAEVRAAVAVALWRVARDPGAGKVLRGLLEEDGRTARDWRVYGTVLSRIDPGPDTVAALEKGLKSEDPGVVVAAARVLGAESKDAVPSLITMLSHKDARVRAEAVVALANLGPAARDAADALRGTAKDDEPQIAFWAAVAACRLDPTPEAVAAVAAYLDDRDPARRRDAATALRPLGAAGKPAAAKLTAALDDPDGLTRLYAALTLWKVDGAPAALPAAVRCFGDYDPLVRGLAASDVGFEFGPDAKAAVPGLVKCLFDPFASVRASAAEALGRVGPGAKDAAPVLVALLGGDEPGFVQSAACEALGLIGPADKDAAAAVLRKKLDHPDPLVRVHAGLALFVVAGDEAGRKGAERGLGHRAHHVRITAAETLWRMDKDERVVPLLVRALEEANLDGTGMTNERYMAARLLGRTGAAGKPAVPELVKLLAHPDPQLAAAAAEALKAVDPDAAKKAGVR